MLNCIVVFGGKSCEHDISIVTGGQTMANLDEYLYNIIPIYIDKDGVWWTGESLKDLDNYPNNLSNLKKVSFVCGDNSLYILRGKKYVKYIEVDFAILCLHGVNGEDGCVAGMMEMSNIPYSATSIMGSALCMDKSIFKTFCKGADINVVDGFSIDHSEFLKDKEVVKGKVVSFGLPVILKPARQGSSVGIKVCNDESQIIAYISDVFNYDDRIVVEKYINIDKEINIALFDNKGAILFSQTETPIYKNEILSFDDKYLKSPKAFEGIDRIMPAPISSELENEIKEISFNLYRMLKLFGVVRFDFILSKEGVLYVNEINTIPGSMANYLFDKLSFGKLLNLIKSNSVFRFEKNKKIKTTYQTDFLKGDKKFIKK